MYEFIKKINLAKGTTTLNYFGEKYEISFYAIRFWLGTSYIPCDFAGGIFISHPNELVKATRLEF